MTTSTATPDKGHNRTKGCRQIGTTGSHHGDNDDANANDGDRDRDDNDDNDDRDGGDNDDDGDATGQQADRGHDDGATAGGLFCFFQVDFVL
jgi:hypothetical protein